MGAALFLGEVVGWRRWSAIAVGLVGVIVILRPGLEGFRAEALWAVLGVVGLSARDVVTRRVPAGTTTLQLTAWAFAAVAFAGVATLGLGGAMSVPPLRTAVELGVALGLGLVGYGLLTIAVRGGDLSVVAPFRYSRLVFALFVGFFVFAERPDLPMLLGASLIVGSGLYTLMREARLRRVARSSP
jgi:drug/metabolite transporter (DMT)-like permease